MSAASLRDIKDHLQFRVMWELQDRADRHGRAWPSEATLAECIGCCVKTVSKAVRALEAAGWLRVWRRRKRLNIYYLKRISGPEYPRRAHKRISPYRDIQKSGEVGGASRPPDDFPNRSAPASASARCSRVAGAQAEQPETPRNPEKTALPDGWLPPVEDIDYALKHTDQNIKWCQREIGKFLEYCRRTGRVSACWQLEWRRWVARGLAYREKRLFRPSRRITRHAA